MARPPFFAIARNWSSLRLRGTSVRARALECVATTGAKVTSSTSRNVFSETCETSIIMPSRFISRITSRPKCVRPLCSGLPAHESAQSLWLAQVRVM